jgi:hypothetical protein
MIELVCLNCSLQGRAEWLLTALCGRWLTTRRLAEVAPKPTPMITLTNNKVEWRRDVPYLRAV